MCTTRKATGVLITLGVVLATAGCGGGSGASTDPVTPDELTIGVTQVPTTLDPNQLYYRSQIGIMHLAAGTLVNLDPDGKSVSMGLAESVEEGDDRYVIKLKPDLTFSDDSELTASDVAATLNFYINDETSGWPQNFAPVSKVTPVDDLTVNIDLKHPYASLPFILGQPNLAILPSEAIDAKGASAEALYAGDPLPTAGQFQVESLTKDQVVLKANPNYAGPQPSVNTVTFKQIADPNARLAQVQSGQLDYADTMPPKQIAGLSAPVEGRSVLPVLGSFFLGMNNRPASLLSDVRIRQAISLAIDRNQINEVAYAGQAPPALGLFSESSDSYQPFAAPDPDFAGAKELLAGTKCASGCTLEFLATSDDANSSDTATVVQQNLIEIGIDTEIKLEPSAVFNEDRGSGNFDLTWMGLYDTADMPDDYLYWAAKSDIFVASNVGYSNPEMDQLIDAVARTKGSERAEAIDQALAIFQRDLPFTPLVGYPVTAASRVPAELFGSDATLYYHVG